MEGGSYVVGARVPSSLRHGVAACEGIPCTSWFSKRVILRYASGYDVGIGLCHSVDSSLIPQFEVVLLELTMLLF